MNNSLRTPNFDFAFIAYPFVQCWLKMMLFVEGTQLTLCNPVMLVLVAFVLWASLLHVTMEEERELFDEFPGRAERLPKAPLLLRDIERDQ